jgi:hypothetical protein
MKKANLIVNGFGSEGETLNSEQLEVQISNDLVPPFLWLFQSLSIFNIVISSPISNPFSRRT